LAASLKRVVFPIPGSPNEDHRVLSVELGERGTPFPGLPCAVINDM